MFSFLIQVVLVSLSGVLAPGPVTTATLAAGTHRKHAGAYIALGHALVEFPLMLLIIAGMGKIFQLRSMSIGIGLLGGGFLIHLGVSLLRSLNRPESAANPRNTRHPFWIGVILTGGNPYFLIWWATVGLKLSSEAVRLGSLAFVVFTLTHWLCDLVWLEILSQASYRGTQVFGARSQKWVLSLCSLALIGIGLSFLYDAIKTLTA